MHRPQGTPEAGARQVECRPDGDHDKTQSEIIEPCRRRQRQAEQRRRRIWRRAGGRRLHDALRAERRVGVEAVRNSGRRLPRRRLDFGRNQRAIAALAARARVGRLRELRDAARRGAAVPQQLELAPAGVGRPVQCAGDKPAERPARGGGGPGK